MINLIVIFNCMDSKNIIRHLIRELAREIDLRQEYESAGVVCLKKIDNIWHVLSLRKHNGNYDITKGLIDDEDATPLDAAKREAREEANITDMEFLWGDVSKSYGKGITFICQTSQEPEILPNPESGDFEHESAAWLTFDDLIQKLTGTKTEYLVPAIEWARIISQQ